MAKTSSRRGSDAPSELSQRKRKGPPKFQHLPHATAKKLKQQWVERKKLQSAYFGKGKGKKPAATGGEPETTPAPAKTHKGDDTLAVEDILADMDGEDSAEYDDDDDASEDTSADADEEEIDGDADDGAMDTSPSFHSEALVDDDDDDDDPDDFRMRTPSPPSLKTLNGSYRGGTSLVREAELPTHAAGPSRRHPHPHPQRHGQGQGQGQRPARQPSTPVSTSASKPKTQPRAAGYQGGAALGRVDRKGSVRRPSGSTSGAEPNGKSSGAGGERQWASGNREEQAREEREEAARRRARAKTAYGSESLHTYRSDAFGKGKGKGTPKSGRANGSGAGAGGGTGMGMRGGQSNGHGRAGEKGRGQPNMKLRMGALLETIKRNVGHRE